MEAHNGYIDTTQVAGVVPATNAETVAIVLPGISVNGGVQIIIEAFASLTTGASTTAVTARVRRGAVVGGALVGAAAPVQVGAALPTSVGLQVGDLFANDVAGQQYCLTLQQTAGTGNGSALYASIQASWISQ